MVGVTKRRGNELVREDLLTLCECPDPAPFVSADTHNMDREKASKYLPGECMRCRLLVPTCL